MWGRVADPVFQTLHRPSYLEEVSNLKPLPWLLFSLTYWSTEQFKRLIDLPPDEAAQNVRPEWLCSHLMVLCLAFFHLESPEREALGFTFEQTQQLAHAHFLASRVRSLRVAASQDEERTELTPTPCSQELLFSSDFLAHHSLEHLQAIV